MSLNISPSVSRQVLVALVAAVEQAGVERGRFLYALALDERDLHVSGARLSLSELAECCALAVELTGDPALALHWAEGISERAFGPVSHLLTHTGTLRRGLALIKHFLPVFCDDSAFEVVEDSEWVSIRLARWDFENPVITRFVAEMVLAGMLKMIRGCFDPLAAPVRAGFRYEAPSYAGEYQRAFGPEIGFAQPVSELVFERALLDRSSPYVDQELHDAMRSVAELRLARVTLKTPYAARVRTHLVARLPARSSMVLAAEAMGMSERSLRRHLADEGTTYREIEYAVLETSAKQLLCERGLTIQETAEAMGYADAATFHRAFKTWTGLTPSAFRDKL